VLADELLKINDEDVKVFNVENIEDIPEQFRDRAKKIKGSTVKVRKKILGLPIGKETTKKIGEGYRYTLTGKEIKNYAIQEPSTETVDAQEPAEGRPTMGETVPGTGTITEPTEVEADKTKVEEEVATLEQEKATELEPYVLLRMKT
jgi:hypothetical protein